jgi:hypothetical protein
MRVAQLQIAVATLGICLLAPITVARAQSTPPPPRRDDAARTDLGDTPDTRAVRQTLDSLYAAFSFDPGKAPNWTALRALMVQGAAFVDPVKPKASPHAIGADEFLANFRKWVQETPRGKAGFKERIVNARIDSFGHIAHAFVTFEGYTPGRTLAEERGLDSIQLVLDGTRWKVASFTTQYEEPGLAMPKRFAAAR